MQTIINLKFSDVTSYRKAVGFELLSRMSINWSDEITILEIGPGQSSELVKKIESLNAVKKNTTFVEPDIKAAQNLKNKFKSAKVIVKDIESALPEIKDKSFNFIYANFSLHWSERLDEVADVLSKSLIPGGEIGFTITDQIRSFWGQVNSEFKKEHPGCDLFNVKDSRDLLPKDWKSLFEQTGLTLKEELVFEGVASVTESPEMALTGFKKACGDKYLKLSKDCTVEQAEAWLLTKLKNLKGNSPGLPIPASGLSFIFRKS